MSILWRVLFLLWFPVAFAAFGVCSLLTLVPSALVWVATGDGNRAFKVATFGRAVWWDTTNRIADRAGFAA